MFSLSRQVPVSEDTRKLTWRRSSKSRAATRFKLEVFFANLRIVPLPKVGTLLYLGKFIFVYRLIEPESKVTYL